MTSAMSRRTSTNVPRATSTRAAILAAAVEILHREGAAALTVRSVAAAAGCSTTGVYTWYGSKNGLVEAIFIDGFERFGQAQQDVRGAGDAVDLSNLADAYRDWALANPTHYMVMFGKAVPDYVPSAAAQAAALATFDDLVAATAGRDAAYHLWAGIHGYVSLELAGMDIATTEEERAARFRLGMTLLMRGMAATERSA